MCQEECDSDYLVALNELLWPKNYKSDSPIALTPVRRLGFEEWQMVKELIVSCNLLTSMFCADMFGAYGMYVFRHETFPGTGPTKLLTVVEGNLPELTRYEVLDGAERAKKQPGSGSDYAWAEFSQFTHSEKNKEWLREYRMTLPRSRGYYDY